VQSSVVVFDVVFGRDHYSKLGMTGNKELAVGIAILIDISFEFILVIFFDLGYLTSLSVPNTFFSVAHILYIVSGQAYIYPNLTSAGRCFSHTKRWYFIHINFIQKIS